MSNIFVYNALTQCHFRCSLHISHWVWGLLFPELPFLPAYFTRSSFCTERPQNFTQPMQMYPEPNHQRPLTFLISRAVKSPFMTIECRPKVTRVRGREPIKLFYVYRWFLYSSVKCLQTAKSIKWETPQSNMFFKDVVSFIFFCSLSDRSTFTTVLCNCNRLPTVQNIWAKVLKTSNLWHNSYICFVKKWCSFLQCVKS